MGLGEAGDLNDHRTAKNSKQHGNIGVKFMYFTQNEESKKSSALLLIDMQKGFSDPIWGVRNNLNAEHQAQKLLRFFRQFSGTVIHIQHLSSTFGSPLYPGQAGVEFMDEVRPELGERVFQKSVNSAFIGTNLAWFLNENGIEELIMMGFTTDHCVSTSARMARNLGFKVAVVSDATVAFERHDNTTTYSADLVHAVNLSSLRGEFAEIISSSSILGS